MSVKKPFSPYRWWSRLKVLIVTGAFDLLRATWRVERRGEVFLLDAMHDSGAVLAFWHEQQLTMIHAHVHRGITGLVSRSSDGSLLSDAIGTLGYAVIRGSSSKGGVVAARRCLTTLGSKESIAVAVDGPIGPRRVAKSGAVALAFLSSCPIVYAVSTASRSLRIRSWDRFEIPLPFARVRIAYGRMGADECAHYENARVILERKMSDLSCKLS